MNVAYPCKCGSQQIGWIFSRSRQFLDPICRARLDRSQRDTKETELRRYPQAPVDSNCSTDWMFYCPKILISFWLTLGNMVRSGNQQERAATPARVWEERRAEKRDKAPPCEKPPINIRLEGIPFFTSSSIKLWTPAAARLMPSSSSPALWSRPFRSNLKWEYGILDDSFL